MYFIFATSSCDVDQVDFEPMTTVPQSPLCWDCRSLHTSVLQIPLRCPPSSGCP